MARKRRESLHSNSEGATAPEHEKHENVTRLHETIIVVVVITYNHYRLRQFVNSLF